MERPDFVVIGSGIAGLWFALDAARYGRVLILTKKEEADSNTNHAQGGIATALDPADSVDLHVKDTLECGAGLCNETAVRVLVSEGPALVHELFRMGTPFDRRKNGSFDLGREGGHSINRIVHAHDFTGREIERSLLDAVQKMGDRIRVESFHQAVDLFVEEGECRGVWVLDTRSCRVRLVRTRAVLLASGGCGRVYRFTTNPSIATGDGVAMAYRAGAVVSDLEFIQFHPTALYRPEEEKRPFLVSEAVRGEGAVLKTLGGEEFMQKYHPRGSLAPRDVVARAINAEMIERGDSHVLLDATHLGAAKIQERFPNISAQLKEYNLDMSRMLIPVIPAAHYLCGGVETDLNGETCLARLFAAGETACTGVHGANRLASNSLLEALVFARRASHSAVRYLDRPFPKGEEPEHVIEERKISGLVPLYIEAIREVMTKYAGIVRDDARLAFAASELRQINSQVERLFGTFQLTRKLVELRNIGLVAELIVRSALGREESRGLHFTTDHPEKDDSLRKHSRLKGDASRFPLRV